MEKLKNLSLEETKEINGGVPWWMYIFGPGTAYIVDKFEEGFEDGCQCQL